MYRTRMTSSVLAVAVLLASTTSGSQQTTLRWRFEAGQEHVYRMTMVSETEMPGGQGMVISENVQTLLWEVIDVSNAGDATVRMTTERVQMKMRGPMANLDVDSASEEPSIEPMAKIFAAMAGTSYTVVFGPGGELKDVQGIDEMRAAIREAVPPETATMLDQMLDSTLSDESIRSMIQQGFQPFPDGSVRPGDSWEVSATMSIPMMGTMTTSTALTFDHVERRNGSSIAVIHSTGTIVTSPDQQSEGPDAGMTRLAGMMEMGDAETIGTMEWDIDRGLLLKNTTSTTMEMTMSMSGRQMVMGVITNMTLELVEDGS